MELANQYPSGADATTCLCHRRHVFEVIALDFPLKKQYFEVIVTCVSVHYDVLLNTLYDTDANSLSTKYKYEHVAAWQPPFQVDPTTNTGALAVQPKCSRQKKAFVGNNHYYTSTRQRNRTCGAITEIHDIDASKSYCRFPLFKSNT